jgi:putative ABC transport system permease protein
MDVLTADLRQTLRGLSQSPGFAAAAIGILALGLAANTAVFSVADAVLFRPLVYDHPEQLVTIDEVIPKFTNLYPRLPVNARHYYEWQARSHSFVDLAVLRAGSLNLTGQDSPPERLGIERVSSNLFSVLGVHPMLGRDFTAEEDRPNNNRVVIITEALWRRRFHSEPAILNKTILLSGSPHVVVGVLPARFRFPRQDRIMPLGDAALNVDLFKPIAFDRAKLNPVGEFNESVIARLRPGVTRQQALAELNSVQAALTKEFGGGELEFRAEITPLQDEIVAGSRRGLLMLLAAIGAVLLIMCVNLGNLMLSRAAARSREMSVRAALGATTWRLVRQVLTESLVISFAGGVAGFALASIAVRALVAAAPVDLPRLDEVHLDYRALLFAFAISLLSGLLFGLIPAWRASRSQPQDALRTGGRSTTQGRRGVRISEMLVSAEVALSAALLVGAGLLIGSMIRVLGIQQNFRADNVLTVNLNLPDAKYPGGKQRSALFDRLLPAIQNLPGVQAAGLTSALPLQGETWVDMITRDDDHRPIFQRPVANYRFVSPDYFAAMGTPMRSGRPFSSADRTGHVATVSPTTAARIWPGQNPIGKHMRRSEDSAPFSEVVGVVADTRTAMKGDPPMMVFLPYWKYFESSATFAIRTSQDPAAAATAVRSAIWSIDSELPVPEMKTMHRVINEAVSQRRFQTALLAGFALTALILAILGIYGVISYAVARRRNEIGIRMALGAQQGQVSRMVLRQGMRPVAIGLLLGIAGAIAIGRILQSLLFEMRTTDPIVLASVALVLGSAAAAACYAPARRATRVDPSTELRYQ